MRRLWVVVAAAILALFTLLPGPATAANPPKHDELVVRVTSYGGVTWGHVDVYIREGGSLVFFHRCAHRRCYYYPRHGVQLFFREFSRSKHQQWKFRSWIVRNGGKTLHIHKSTLSLHVIGHLNYGSIWYRARVRANFWVP